MKKLREKCIQQRITRVANPAGFDPDSDPSVKKKPVPDLKLKKKPGSGSYHQEKTVPNLAVKKEPISDLTVKKTGSGSDRQEKAGSGAK